VVDARRPRCVIGRVVFRPERNQAEATEGRRGWNPKVRWHEISYRHAAHTLPDHPSSVERLAAVSTLDATNTLQRVDPILYQGIMRSACQRGPSPSGRAWAWDSADVSLRPETHFARRDGAHLAYRVFGDGPPDILYINGFATHIEHVWQWPLLTRSRELLARLGRVATYDWRGENHLDESDAAPTRGVGRRSAQSAERTARCRWDRRRETVFGR
jgi:hypothetical protein